MYQEELDAKATDAARDILAGFVEYVPQGLIPRVHNGLKLAYLKGNRDGYAEAAQDTQNGLRAER